MGQVCGWARAVMGVTQVRAFVLLGEGPWAVGGALSGGLGQGKAGAGAAPRWVELERAAAL